MREGLIGTDEAFGKRGVLLENSIKNIGWTATPFYSMIGRAAPADRSSNVALGHSWFYDKAPEAENTNAHFEGGEMAKLNKYTGASLKNHFQIVKNAYGVTGSQSAGQNIDGSATLARQGKMASIQHKKTIEKILLSDTKAVARVNTQGAEVAGVCGGLKSFASTENEINANGADLTWDHILQLLKVGYLQNAEYKVIMMNDKQKDRLDAILDKKQKATMDTNFLGSAVQTIKNTSYGSNIKVILNPFLDDTEIIAFRPEDIYLVHWRPMATKERITTSDELIKEIISEFTLRVCTPYAFSWLKGLKA